MRVQLIMLLRWRASTSTRSLRTIFASEIARTISSAPPLIRIENGTFYEEYPGSKESLSVHKPPLFPGLHFEVPSTKAVDGNLKTCNKLQHWAIVGSDGRAEFLRVLRGQYFCEPPTARSYPYLLTDEIAAKDSRLRYVGNAIQYLGFGGGDSGTIRGLRGAYLSARYESLREETDWTVRQYLRGQMSLNPLEGEKQSAYDETLFAEVIHDLRLDALLDLPMTSLSNGQTRRAQIAKAVLLKPELLLIDEPFVGLDPSAVTSISGFLLKLAAKSAPRLVLALRPQDMLPEWITHTMVLGNGYRVLLQGTKTEVEKAFSVWKHLGKKHGGAALSHTDKHILDQAKAYVKEGVLNRQMLRDLGLVEIYPRAVPEHNATWGEPVIEMDGVQVRYGERVVLGGWTQAVGGQEKIGLHWTVRRGQRWAILGANGSGKTTLLSLITSDHPQTYSLPIKLFGRTRLPEAGKPGISIFELQARIGHSSPEIHAIFPRHLSIRQAVESAFAETFLARPKMGFEQDLDVTAVLNFFQDDLFPRFQAAPVEVQKIPQSTDSDLVLPRIRDTRSRKTIVVPYLDEDPEWADSIRFGDLNVAQQRLVLFLRALIHKPDLVLLDEPFAGMRASLRDKCLRFLETGEGDSKYKANAVLHPATGSDEGMSKSATGNAASVRFRGLTDAQALIFISHVREDIPASVRHIMRLPSSAGDGSNPLDYRTGTLHPGVRLHSRAWNAIWTPPSEVGRLKVHKYFDGWDESDDTPDR